MCGKLDRGLKVERFSSLSASRMFTYISNLSLATNLTNNFGNKIGDCKSNGKECLRCSAFELTDLKCSGSNTCICKNCRKLSLESTLFQTLLKFENRYHSAKSSRGLHGLLSYPKQRQLLEFPTIKDNENYECDDQNCRACRPIKEDRDVSVLDNNTHEELLLCLAFFEEQISGQMVSPIISRSFIEWVDSSFGVSVQEMKK